MKFEYIIDHVSATFPFIVCAGALLDLRFRQVRNTEDSNARYAREWILVGIPQATLRAICDLVTPRLGGGYRIDTTNFKESDDGRYVTTVANLKVDPRFVEVDRQGGGINQNYRGDLQAIYSSRMDGIHKGFLIFDPFLLADVPGAVRGGRGAPHACTLKLRLVGIRSFGETQGADQYFATPVEDL